MTNHERNLRLLSGETLRRLSFRADKQLGDEIDRVQLHDEGLRDALNWALALEAEIQRRRNR